MIRHVEFPIPTSLIGARDDDEMPPPLGIYSMHIQDEARIARKKVKEWKEEGDMLARGEVVDPRLGPYI